MVFVADVELKPMGGAPIVLVFEVAMVEVVDMLAAAVVEKVVVVGIVEGR